MQTSSSTERDKFELASLRDAPTLLDFLGSVPAPVSKVLVEFAYPIHLLNRFAFAASWKSSAEQSFLLLFTWVAVCLYGGLFVRFALIPIIILGPVILPRLPQRFQYKKPIVTTEEALASSLSDLDGIYALRPDFTLRDPLPPHLSFQERLRVLGVLLPSFITLTYWTSLRVVLAIAGALVLTHRAPWAITTRRILTRSAYIRAAWRYIINWISGNYSIPITRPIRSMSLKPTDTKVDIEPTKAPKKHAFMFTVLENQRWWVGIDWTAALLPSERPSWCAPIAPGTLASTQGSNQPVFHALPPPASFPLPPSTSVTLPSSTGQGYVRKTARWKWQEDSEWEVLVRKEGEDKIRKLRPPLKASHPEEDNKGQLLAKAAGKLSANPSPTTSSFTDHEGGTSSKPSPTAAPSAHPENEYTDQDGWIYGDNKWDNLAGKAGMGKFTRFRRWCRVAILEEREEPVDEPDAKLSFTQLEPRRSISAEKDRAESLVEKSAHSRERSESKGSPERTRGRTTDSRLSIGGEQSLQQRLKAALKSSS